MSLRDSKQEHNVLRQGIRWLDQIRSQRIAPCFKLIEHWDGFIREMRPRWERVLHDATRYADHMRHVLLHIWGDAWHYAAPHADHILRQVLPQWMDTLRGALRHAIHTLIEALPRWKQAAWDGAQHTAHAVRVLIVASAVFMDRHVPFRLYERNWWRGAANAARSIPRLLAIVLIGTVVVAFAVTMASHSALLASLHLPQPATSDPNATGKVVLHQGATPVATPPASVNQVGIWTTTPNPPASGTVQVYVRASENDQPVHVVVMLEVQQGEVRPHTAPT